MNGVGLPQSSLKYIAVAISITCHLLICLNTMLQDPLNPAGGPGTKLSDKFSGTVCEVVSGDCIVVRDKANGQERRVNLSSIKAPRLGRKEEKPEPWAIEAKEFLRQRLIGWLPLLLCLPLCTEHSPAGVTCISLCEGCVKAAGSGVCLLDPADAPLRDCRVWSL